jgi:Ca2+-binding RTX toxin-like protein
MSPLLRLLTAYIVAGDGQDTIKGSLTNNAYYDEELYGGDGNDVIFGYAGDDIISGDDDDDTIEGGDGNDTINGGANHDEIHGGNGADTIIGDAGDDAIAGGEGDDVLNGGAGDDNVCGDTHVVGDVLEDGDGAAGVDKLWGNGSLNDAVYCNNASTQVDAGSTQFGVCAAAALVASPCNF